MELSIIVPVYNMAAEGKLEYCLDSLLNQQVADYEIIAVDDASTDTSAEILNRYAKQYPEKVRVILSEKNLRQGGAKNLGIRAARGDFLGFMDSDDWAAPDMFAKLLARAYETGADVVGCDYNIVHSHTMTPGRVVTMNTGEQTGILDEEKKKKMILMPGSMVVKIYKREIVTDNELWFPEHIFYEDNCMAPLWLLHCKHFERVDEPLYFYYQHEASTVHYISVQKCRDRVTAMELFLEKCRTYGFYDRFFPEIEYKYTVLAFLTTLFSCMGSRTKGKYRLIGELRRIQKKRFPRYAENVYYKERTDREEQRLAAMLMRSRLLFWLYYYALHGYRRLRKAMTGGKG